MAEDERFLDRWARLKTEVKEGKPADRDVASLGPEGGGPPAEVEGDATAEQLDLPDIESLTEDSDFTPFMQDGVPDKIRTMAMRRLWRMNPIFAHIDGLDDYDEDYTDAAMVVGSLKEAWEQFQKRHEEDDGEAPAETAESVAEDDGEPAETDGEPDQVAGAGNKEIPDAEDDLTEDDDGDTDLPR